MTDQPEYDEPTSVTMPPASIQAEEALLGAFLINPDIFREISINPGDFYIARNRWIYEAIAETAHCGKQVDFMTVCQTLEDNGNLPKIGGAAYLMSMVNATPTSLHAETYAEIVKDRAQRRRMIDIANTLAQNAFDLTLDVEKSVAQSATDLANSSRPKGGAQHVSIFASRHYDRVDRLSRGEGQIQRIPTGFIDFDKCLIGGLRIPEMLLLMGKPGLGKTKFILQLGFNMGQYMPGAIYEMETDEYQTMDREISRRSEILDTHLETGQLDESEWPAYTQAIEELSDTNHTKVYLDFGSGWTTSTLRSDLARLKIEHNIKWYMVDYLKFLRDPFGKDETERLNFISGRLKQINRELGLASVIIHSMNKTGVDAIMPSLSNMSGGADIGFDTDKALFMARHTPEEGQPTYENYRTFFFQKSRSRIADSIFHLQAKKEFPTFLDATKPGQKEPEDHRRKQPGVDY